MSQNGYGTGLHVVRTGHAGAMYHHPRECHSRAARLRGSVRLSRGRPGSQRRARRIGPMTRGQRPERVRHDFPHECSSKRVVRQSLTHACQARSQHSRFRGSIMVSISACHAEDPGSIPGRGGLFLLTLCGGWSQGRRQGLSPDSRQAPAFFCTRCLHDLHDLSYRWRPYRVECTGFFRPPKLSGAGPG